MPWYYKITHISQSCVIFHPWTTYRLFPGECTSIGVLFWFYVLKINAFSVAWVELGGTMYKCGAFVVTSSELLPQFSQIVDIVVTERSQCVFIREEYETNCFCKHFHAYEIAENNTCTHELHVIQQSSLVDFHPLSRHSVSNSFYICMKYHVVEQFWLFNIMIISLYTCNKFPN